MQQSNIFAATHGPLHHFFGFHDLIAWNHDDSRMAGLAVTAINHPPLPDQYASVGYVEMTTMEWHDVAQTCAFNYPQGARTQWLSNTNHLIFNSLIGQRWGCEIYDSTTKRKLQELSTTAHIVDAASGRVFGIDYARLNRFGAYGYAGLPDSTRSLNAPEESGIWVNQIDRDAPELLISIRTVAEFDASFSMRHYAHYLTHLVLSPDRRRIAFLHRYRTQEGEMTRLMTIGTNGRELCCLGHGSLSHYDWVDNTHLMIWGRMGTMAENLRNNPLYALAPKPFLRALKKIAAPLIRHRVQKMPRQEWSMLYLTDAPAPMPKSVLLDTVTENVHQMTNPVKRDWMICDTYPNLQGNRTLFLVNLKTAQRIDLGQFHIIADPVDTSRLAEAFQYIDLTTLDQDAVRQLPFFRSGLHCDLHPRWNNAGTAVAFDSIHEGTRQIYVADVKDMVQ